MSFGLFENATYSPTESQLRKEAAADKLDAAIYDVRQRFGSYLFQADSAQGFDDRARLMYADICKTIEPHLHARTGVHARVMKTLKKEWKTAALTENTLAQNQDAAIANSAAGPKGMKTPHAPNMHVHGPQLEGRKTAGPPVSQDPDRAHRVLDHTHNKVDEHAQKQHSVVDHAHELVDQHDPYGGDPIADLMGSGLGQNYQNEQAMGFQPQQHAPEQFQGRPGPTPDLVIPNPHASADPWGDSSYDEDPYAGAAEEQLHSQHQGPGNPDPREFFHPLANKIACWPGCHEDEAHAKKFHKKKGDEKESRRQAAQPRDPHFENDYGDHFRFDEQHGRPVHEISRENPEEFGEFHRSLFGALEDQPDHPTLDTNVTFDSGSQGDTLKPKGDFDAYKDSVDQGAPSKVDRDFVSPDPRGTSPAIVKHHDENGDHNFVPKVTGSYRAIARLIQGDNMPTPQPSGGAAPSMPVGGGSGAQNVPQPPMSGAAAGTSPTAPIVASAYHQISAMLRQSAPGMPTPPPGPGGGGTPPGILQEAPGGGPPAPSGATPGSTGTLTPPNPISPGQGFQQVPGGAPLPSDEAPGFGGGPMAQHMGRSKWALKQIQEVGTKEARLRLLAVARSHGILTDKTAARLHTMYTRKVADSNYLQKADEALTKVLNEKAEEFQQTIAPLQQALITIQQAEQMANPLNVSPPAGTVNVLPGQQQAGGAGAAAMGASGGGVGMGVDPAAAGLAGQPATQAMQQTARRRGGHPKGRGPRG